MYSTIVNNSKKVIRIVFPNGCRLTITAIIDENYYPQRAQRAGGIVRVWQIFGHGYDFPTWSELGTKSRVKVTYFGGKKYLEEF